MSVSMCVFRLEIADECPLLTNLHYTAPKFVATMAANQTNQAVQCDGNPNEWTEKVEASDEVKKTHRGIRQIHNISVETFTQNESPTTSLPPSKESSPNPNEGDKKAKSSNQINFFSGNPFVEVTKGILHLYKENQMTSLKDDVARSEMLCILAVPSQMTTHDLLQFAAPCSPVIENLRIIRDATPNQYMVLVKFRCQEAADEFYKAFNGVRFNSIEQEVCHLVYVAKVETTKEEDAGFLPLEGHTELPTCPVCLERMDESVDGILTILCNHSFHGNCLSKWGDSSCPVCRYCQTPELTADNRCFQCHSQENLWICLICGHIGCGRYIEGHAYKHFQETQHTYAMQLGNNRVWDYAGDNYVHRLVQNKTDGKLVELDERASMEHDEKIDSIQLEYTYLLTSQLESQRAYFEERIARFEKDAHMQIEELKERTKQSVDESKKLQEQLQASCQEKSTQEKKVQLLSSKLSTVAKDLKDETEMNKCLLKNQQVWQNKVRDLERQLSEVQEIKTKEVAELQDQLRDIMFHLNAQEQLQQTTSASQQDIQEGTIVVGAGAPAPSRHHRKKRTR